MQLERRVLTATIAAAAVALTPALAAAKPHVSASPAITMCNVGVTMSDGAVMRANVVRPGPGKHATIMIVDGYNKDLGDPEGHCKSYDSSLTAAGFNVVTWDDRGTGSSDGTWGVWNHRTQQDYAEELKWIEKQPWQNGKIGTTGTSYLAITSLLVAETGDPHVKAVFANYPMADAFRDVTYFGGELDSTFMPFWFGFTQATSTMVPTQLLQGDVGTAPAITLGHRLLRGAGAVGAAAIVNAALLDEKNNGLNSPYDDAAFKYSSPATRASKIHAAVFWVGGWYDIFQRGEPYLWHALTGTPKGGKVWVQGATYHGGAIPQWSSLGYGPTEESTEVAWFQHYLDGTHNQFGASSAAHHVSPINLWEVGANHWGRYSSWPLPGTKWTSSYLSAAKSGSSLNSLNDGSLTSAAGQATGSSAMPFEPVGSLCDRGDAQWSAGITAGLPCTTNETLAETGTLTFTTAPLEQPMHIAGPITLNLWATLSRPDASLYAAVTDVSSTGSQEISSGGLDAQFRALDQAKTWRDSAGQVILPYHPFTKASLEPVPAGKPELYRIEIYPTDTTIAAGDRLRLVVGTANTPGFVVPVDRLTQMLGGTVTVLSSGSHRSSLLLPLRPTDSK
ncbi:MAG TPA: CocE/NonD family hydrolase [Mycobacteriales bacterium]|nr:CocE/NonD family hydrolase [Mycobacteriales bacterium]